MCNVFLHCLVFYSVRNASTGFCLAALSEGNNPANIDKRTFIKINSKAV